MKHRTLVVATVATVVGVVLQLFYMKRFEAEVSGGSPVSVLVAARDLEPGEVLTKEHLGVRQIPTAYVELRNIRVDDSDTLLGERVAAHVRSGETLLWSDLQLDAARDADLATRIRPGMRAVTLQAGGERGFGEMLRPGDRVDVLVSGNNADAMSAMTRGGPRTETLLQNVLVLAVGTDIGGGTAGKSLARRTNRVTVSVTPSDAEKVAQAEQRGHLTLTLRNPDDAIVVEAQDAHGAGVLSAGADISPAASALVRALSAHGSKGIEHVR